MPTIDLRINGNIHTVSCNHGEEERLMSLAIAFNSKLKQIAPVSGDVDDKTLYLITALVLLDEAADKSGAVINQRSTLGGNFLDKASNKIHSIRELLVGS